MSFASYGGMVSRNGFSGVGYQDVSNGIHLPNYGLQGLVKLSSALSLNFATTMDNDFVFGFRQDGSNIDFVVSGVMFGVSPKLICADSPNKYALDSDCVGSCPANTFPFTYKDGGLGCHRCSSKLNLVYDANKRQCVCVMGFDLENGVCVRSQSATKSSVEEFASLGVVKTGNDVSSINQNANSAVTVTNTAVVVSITSNKPFDGSANTQPVISVAPVLRPTVNAPASTTTGSATILNPSTNFSIANSYAPSVPNQLPPSQPVQPIPNVAPILPPISAESASNARSCANFANTYWTGYRCSCRVGYRLEQTSGACLKIGLSTNITIPPYNPYYPPVDPNYGQCKPNEVFTYGQCVCASGYTRDNRNDCVLNVVCPENGYMENGVCVCRNGYYLQSGRCVPSQDNQCPVNMHFNGNRCVCNMGYEEDETGKCRFANLCPPNSEKNQNGVCVCRTGFREIRPGVCSQCDAGAVNIGGQCSYPCGVN